MNIQSLFRIIKRKMKGRLQTAIDDGMVVEPGVTVMGGVVTHDIPDEMVWGGPGSPDVFHLGVC